MSDADKPRDELEGTEAPFVSHLVELRDRLIRALIAVGVAFGVLAFWPGPGPLYDLLAAPLVANLPAGATLIATNVISPFMVPLKITLMAAFLVALPVVLYQVWAFVAPGLYSHEKKMVLPLVVSSTVLFFLGVAFCYFFVFGQVFKFIQGFAPKSITAAPDIEAYLSFVMTMFIAFGAAFEVPVAVVVLARLGVVSIEQLKKFRGYFIVGGLHRLGHHHAARRGVAAGAGDPDVPALRVRHLVRRSCSSSTPRRRTQRRRPTPTPSLTAARAGARRATRLLGRAALRPGPLRHGQLELQRLVAALHRNAGIGLRLQCGHRRKQLCRVADLGAADREHHVARSQPAAAGRVRPAARR